MRNIDKDSFAFGQQVAVEAILRALIDAELNKCATDAQKHARKLELRHASEKAFDEGLKDNLDPSSDTFDDASAGGKEVTDAVFGWTPDP